MTEKELLYVTDAIEHEEYMINTIKEAEDCLTDEELIKFSKKILKKHENILNLFKELLESEAV